MKTPEFVLWQHGRDGRTVDWQLLDWI
jgi:hypothetical protein